MRSFTYRLKNRRISVVRHQSGNVQIRTKKLIRDFHGGLRISYGDMGFSHEAAECVLDGLLRSDTTAEAQLLTLTMGPMFRYEGKGVTRGGYARTPLHRSYETAYVVSGEVGHGERVQEQVLGHTPPFVYPLLLRAIVGRKASILRKIKDDNTQWFGDRQKEFSQQEVLENEDLLFGLALDLALKHDVPMPVFTAERITINPHFI